MLLGVMDTSADGRVRAALWMQRLRELVARGVAPASSQPAGVASGSRWSSCRCSRCCTRAASHRRRCRYRPSMRSAAGSRARRCASCCAASCKPQDLPVPVRWRALWRCRARHRRCAARAGERGLRIARPVHRRRQCAADGREAEWCERRLLARIHRYTIKSLRAEIEPVASADFMRFLLEWQGVTALPRPRGRGQPGARHRAAGGFRDRRRSPGRAMCCRRGCRSMTAAGSIACVCRGAHSGRALVPPDSARRRRCAPRRSRCLRARNRALWQQLSAARRQPAQLSANAAPWREYLQRHGASFFDEIAHGAGLLPAQAEAALAELVAAGVVERRQFRRPARAAAADAAQAHRRAADARHSSVWKRPGAGAWCAGHRRGAASRARNSQCSRRRTADVRRGGRGVAWLLLRRYGVVFRRLLAREADGCRHGTCCCALIGGSRHRADPRRTLCRRRERRAVRAARGRGRAARGAQARARWRLGALSARRSAEPCRVS